MLTQTKTNETLRLIYCDIADETYGLDMSWVRSIQRTDRLRRNPEADGPSTNHYGKPIGPPGRSPSTGRRGGPVEPSGRSPVGWLPGKEGDIPVFSLANRLGRPPLPPSSAKGGSATQRIIVLNPPPSPPQAGGNEKGPPAGESAGKPPWALLVDRVSQVIQIPTDCVAPLPSIVVNPAADYFKGVIKLDEGLMLFLSPERLHPDAPPAPQVGAGLAPAPDLAPAPGPTPAPRSPAASAGSPRRSHCQIVVFSIAEPYLVERALSFGLSISQILEVLEPLPLIPVPAAPAFVLGLANWRDRSVPVIDLAGRLGLTELARSTTNGRTRLMIARDKGHVLSVRSSVERNSWKGGLNQGALVGFLVRPAIRVLRLPIAHQPSSRPLTLDQALIKGMVELEKETLVVPDIRGILLQNGG